MGLALNGDLKGVSGSSETLGHRVYTNTGDEVSEGCKSVDGYENKCQACVCAHICYFKLQILMNESNICMIVSNSCVITIQCYESVLLLYLN